MPTDFQTWKKNKQAGSPTSTYTPKKNSATLPFEDWKKKRKPEIEAFNASLAEQKRQQQIADNPPVSKPVDQVEHEQKKSAIKSAGLSFLSSVSSGLSLIGGAIESTGRVNKEEGFLGGTFVKKENSFGNSFGDKAFKSIGAGTEKAGKYIKEGFGFGSEMIQESPGYVKEYQTFRDDNGKFDVNKLKDPKVLLNVASSGVGSMAPIIASGYFGGLPAVATSAFLTEKGDAVQSYSEKLAEEKGVSVEKLENEDIAKIDVSSTGYGLASAVLESIMPTKFLKQIGGKEVGKEIVKSIWKRVPMSVGQAILAEGSTEGVQRFTQNVISKLTISDNQSLSEGVLDEAISGALVGGGMGLVGGIAEGQQVNPPQKQVMVDNREEKILSEETAVEQPIIKDEQPPETKKTVSEFLSAIAENNTEKIGELESNMTTEDLTQVLEKLDKVYVASDEETKNVVAKDFEYVEGLLQNREEKVKSVAGEVVVKQGTENLENDVDKLNISEVEEVNSLLEKAKKVLKKNLPVVENKITINTKEANTEIEALKTQKRELLAKKNEVKETNTEKSKEIQQTIDDIDTQINSLKDYSKQPDVNVESSETLPPMGYVQMRKGSDKKYQIFYRGTENVFSPKKFSSVKEANSYYQSLLSEREKKTKVKQGKLQFERPKSRREKVETLVKKGYKSSEVNKMNSDKIEETFLKEIKELKKEKDIRDKKTKEIENDPVKLAAAKELSERLKKEKEISDKEISDKGDEVISSLSDKKINKILSETEFRKKILEIELETNPSIRKWLQFEVIADIVDKAGNKLDGYFDPRTMTIALNRSMTLEQIDSVMREEIGHLATRMLGLEGKAKIMEYYKSLSEKDLESIFGKETLEAYRQSYNNDSMKMADETVQWSLRNKKFYEKNEILRTIRKIIKQILILINKISGKFSKKSKMFNAFDLFSDLFSQNGTDLFSPSNEYLRELKESGHIQGSIRFVEKKSDESNKISDLMLSVRRPEMKIKSVSLEKIIIDEKIIDALNDVKKGKKSTSNLPILVEKDEDGNYKILKGRNIFVQQYQEGKQNFLTIEDENVYNFFLEEEKNNKTGNVNVKVAKNATVEPDTFIQESSKYESAEDFIKEKGIEPESVYIKDNQNFIVENTSGNDAILTELPVKSFGQPEFETLNQSEYKQGKKIASPIEATIRDGEIIITDGANRFTQAVANGDNTIPVIVDNFDGSLPSKYQLTYIWNKANKKPIISEIIKGEELSKQAKEMGTDQGFSDFTLNQIKEEDYKTEIISIDKLRKIDSDLDEYIKSGQIREFEGNPFEMMPIVNSEGGVIDGYGRISQMVRDGEKEVAIYRGISEKQAKKEAKKIKVKAHNRGGVEVKEYERMGNISVPKEATKNETSTEKVKTIVEKRRELLKKKREMEKAYLSSEKGAELIEKNIRETQSYFDANKSVIEGIKNNPYYKKEKAIKDEMGTGYLMEKNGRFVVVESSNVEKYLDRGYTQRIEIDSLASEVGIDNGKDYLEDQLTRTIPIKVETMAKKILSYTDNLYGEINAELARTNEVIQKSKDDKNSFYLGMRVGGEIMKTKYKEKINKLKNRREKVRAAQEFFGLSDNQFSGIGGKRNIQFMTNWEFKQFMDKLRVSAEKELLRSQAREMVVAQIELKNLKKTDNLRLAMKLPPIDKMTYEQLREFDKALEPAQPGDQFFTQRQLETVKNTELAGIKTLREAREVLARKIGEENIIPGSVVVSSTMDKLRYDSALAKQNPFYKMMVDETNIAMLEADSRFLGVEKKILDLVKEARKSRPKKISDKLVPEDLQIFEYLESDNKTELAKLMTNEELVAAEYIRRKFEEMRDYLISNQMLKSGRENYITHIRRDFFENWKTDGFAKAFKEIFEQNKEDQAVFEILSGETGEILPLEKFFQFSLRRTGNLKPSQNVAKAFLTYTKVFERKRALDSLIPKLDIFVYSITPTQTTEKGLVMDRSLKKFVNAWINNKKGRRFDFGGSLKQGGKADVSLRALKFFTSIIDLGLSIPGGVASNFGEQSANFAMQGTKKYSLGVSRGLTSKGRRITEKYRNFVGKNPWIELSEISQNIGNKFFETLFVLFKDSQVRANKQYLLGSLTKEEYQTETISTERLAEMKRDMGRWRVVEGAKSIAGNTSAGGIITQYKTWAIPILTSVSNDTQYLLKTRNFKSKEGAELFRSIIIVGGIGLLIMSILGDDDDDSFIGQVIKRSTRDLLSTFGALDPTLIFSEPRTVSFLTNIATGLKQIIILEKYKTTGDGYEEGNLKGINTIKRAFNPSAIRQIKGKEEKVKNYENILGEKTKSQNKYKTYNQILREAQK